jgi:hypothetical protein
MTDPILQQAPPTNAAAARRGTPAGTAGPVSVGDGQIGAHARWAPGMACGVTVGEVARAETSQPSVSLLKGALMRVPEKLSGMSTTGLERRGDETRSVAAATVTAGRIELAGGRVRVRVLRAPMLTVGMSTRKGGEVRYVPAVVEVSGDGVGRQRLETAGDHVDVTLRPDRRALEDAVTALDGVRKAAPLPVPDVPGLPSLPSLPGLPSPAEPRGESGSVTGAGTRVRISLGDVRQARKGHAIAARATAIKVSVVRSEAGAGHGSAAGSGSRSGPRSGAGYGSGSGGYGSMSLALGLGVLEAAAVAPDAVVAANRGASPEQVSAVAGAGGGLPITGPRAGLLALGGVGLLMTGIAAVLFGTRRRRY